MTQANETVIGKKVAEVIDLNVLNRKKPHTLFKDETYSFYVQNGRIFTLNGSLLADSETSKQDLWKIQQNPVGADALKLAGLEVTLEQTEEENDGQKTFACEVCEQRFLSERALGTHKKLHFDPTKKRK